MRYSSGVVPFRIQGTDRARLQFLLVQSTNKKNWVFPKGGIEEDMTSRANAVKEAFEEAGVIGDLGECVGIFTYRKAANADGTKGQKQHVKLYGMNVALEADHYPEVAIRKRQWFSIEVAKELLSKDLWKAAEMVILQEGFDDADGDTARI